MCCTQHASITQRMHTLSRLVMHPAVDSLRACMQNERIWWLDAVVALVVTIGLAVYSIPVLIKHPWWRRDFWRAYTGQ